MWDFQLCCLSRKQTASEVEVLSPLIAGWSSTFHPSPHHWEPPLTVCDTCQETLRIGDDEMFRFHTSRDRLNCWLKCLYLPGTRFTSVSEEEQWWSKSGITRLVPQCSAEFILIPLQMKIDISSHVKIIKERLLPIIHHVAHQTH